MMQLSHRDWLYPPQAHKFANHEANVISSRRNATMLFDLTDKLIWVAGQHGMVGGAITRRLQREACHLPRDPGRIELDLRCQPAVENWLAVHRPQVVFLRAGCVGGIHANDSLPADYQSDSLLITV